jgi:hypothetical protein
MQILASASMQLAQRNDPVGSIETPAMLFSQVSIENHSGRVKRPLLSVAWGSMMLATKKYFGAPHEEVGRRSSERWSRR